MAIAQRLLPFGVKRLLYTGRTAKAHAAEVNGEFGKKNKEIIHSQVRQKEVKILPIIQRIRFLMNVPILPTALYVYLHLRFLEQFPWTRLCQRVISLWFPAH